MESSSGAQKNQMENVSTNTASGAEVASSPQNNNDTFPAVDSWLAQLLVVAPRSQFNGHNLYLWEMVADQALSPRSLLPHLTQDAPLPTDPRFKRWIVEEQTVRSWLLDSMSTDYFQKFIDYKTAKGIWEAVHKFYSKKNDSSKISSLVSRANSLQQGDKSVMAYANELSSICTSIGPRNTALSSGSILSKTESTTFLKASDQNLKAFGVNSTTAVFLTPSMIL